MTNLYQCVIRPLLFRLDPEQAHDFTLKGLKTGLFPALPSITDPALEVTLWDRKFPNPVGLAAGFDKNAAVIGPLFGLGFGFIEAGTVTPKPQAGNPKPRIFRDQDSESLINALGFPNNGLQTFKTGVERFLMSKPRPPGVLGLNIGMNKGQSDPAKDYALLVRHLGSLADYLTVNISSPNTPGLRDLQQEEHLKPLLAAILEERVRSCGSNLPPLLVKLSPDIANDQKEQIAAVLIEMKIEGLILTNTTLDRPDDLSSDYALNKGGLSGQPLKQKSTATIRDFYRLTKGKIPIIGVGGVASGEDAYEKIRAGASLVQLYTALVYQGPAVVRTINNNLLSCLKRDGFSSVASAVGADHALSA